MSASDDLWVPPGADVPNRGRRAVVSAVSNAPPAIQRAVAGAAAAEVRHREKALRRKANRIARKRRKANRGK